MISVYLKGSFDIIIIIVASIIYIYISVYIHIVYNIERINL